MHHYDETGHIFVCFAHVSLILCLLYFCKYNSAHVNNLWSLGLKYTLTWLHRGKVMLNISNVYFWSWLHILPSYLCVGLQKYSTCTKTLVFQKEVSSRQERYWETTIWTAWIYSENWYYGNETSTTRKGRWLNMSCQYYSVI